MQIRVGRTMIASGRPIGSDWCRAAAPSRTMSCPEAEQAGGHRRQSGRQVHLAFSDQMAQRSRDVPRAARAAHRCARVG